MVYGHPLVVLCFFLVTYVGSTVVFASAFYMCGEGCFRLEPGTGFGFVPMLWISVHVFSTIGFGNIAPRQTCAGAQLIVLLESFCALLVVSAISGYVVKLFLRPLSAVRFSSKVLVNGGRRRVYYSDEEEAEVAAATEQVHPDFLSLRTDETATPTTIKTPAEASTATSSHSRSPEPRRFGPLHRSKRISHTADQAQDVNQYRFLTFRMVRQGRVQLRDVRVQLQAQYWIAGTVAFGDRDSHKGRVCTLELEQSYFTTLEQLQVWHRIDEKSPLWRMRDSLDKYIDSFEVSVSAYDVASLQTVMFFKR